MGRRDTRGISAEQPKYPNVHPSTPRSSSSWSGRQVSCRPPTARPQNRRRLWGTYWGDAANSHYKPLDAGRRGSRGPKPRKHPTKRPSRGLRAFKLGAGGGFEPAVLRGSGGQKAQWDAQKLAELLRVVEAWPNLRHEL